MSSKGTTRRSLSVKGTTYARLHAAARKTGTSISGFAEEVFGEALDRLSIRNFTKEEAEALRPKTAKAAEAAKNSPFEHSPEPTTTTTTEPPPRPSDAFVSAPPRDDAAHVREPPPTKAPTLAPTGAKKPPRGGGVHSF